MLSAMRRLGQICQSLFALTHQILSLVQIGSQIVNWKKIEYYLYYSKEHISDSFNDIS